MAITLALRTDGPRAVTVVGLTVWCCLCPFPQPGPSTLVFTQLLDAVVRQEVTRVLPADVGLHRCISGQMPPPPPFVPTDGLRYHTLAQTFTLLAAGAGVDSFRLKLLDGETVVFDEPFVY
jgi:hypothetical protein